jgi:hypothetical protein
MCFSGATGKHEAVKNQLPYVIGPFMRMHGNIDFSSALVFTNLTDELVACFHVLIFTPTTEGGSPHSGARVLDRRRSSHRGRSRLFPHSTATVGDALDGNQT